MHFSVFVNGTCIAMLDPTKRSADVPRDAALWRGAGMSKFSYGRWPWLQSEVGFGDFQLEESETPGSAPKPSTLVLWFELNSTKLRQDSEADSTIHLALVIKESLDHLKKKGKSAKIILHGFASREGAEARNIQLAGQRADHVKELLVTAGVPDDRIQIVNHGPNSDWPGLPWNRRVEVELQPQP
jgi:hypothetical protein